MSINNLCMGCMTQKNNEGQCAACGFDESTHTPASHHLPLRTILGGKYLVGRVLGEGGFGITYLGWDLNLDLKIAIKEYYPTGFVTRENTKTTNTVTPYVGEKEEFFTKGRARFVDEAKSLAKFYALPGIVSVKDFFLENGTAYIVMEFVEGVTLKQMLSQTGGKLPADQVFEMMKALMNSLAQIHNAGIIHRDISPDNIMVTPEGYVKLLDFGAARNYMDSGNKSMSVLLKPGYAPEEQYRSRGVQGPWTDVYALCATMYKAITGVTPLESIERLQNDEVKPPSAMGARMLPKQEAALMKGMAVLQKNRYQNIQGLWADFYIPNVAEVPADHYKQQIPNENKVTPRENSAGSGFRYQPEAMSASNLQRSFGTKKMAATIIMGVLLCLGNILFRENPIRLSDEGMCILYSFCVLIAMFHSPWMTIFVSLMTTIVMTLLLAYEWDFGFVMFAVNFDLLPAIAGSFLIKRFRWKDSKLKLFLLGLGIALISMASVIFCLPNYFSLSTLSDFNYAAFIASMMADYILAYALWSLICRTSLSKYIQNNQPNTLEKSLNI